MTALDRFDCMGLETHHGTRVQITCTLEAQLGTTEQRAH